MCQVPGHYQISCSLKLGSVINPIAPMQIICTIRVFSLYKFKLDVLQGNGYFCAFSVDLLWGKSDSSYLINYNTY